MTMTKRILVNWTSIFGTFILSIHVLACQQENTQFKKHIITQEFISEGVAVGDVNKDGNLDIMAGTYWFEGPLWTSHEIDSSRTFDPATEYSDSFLNYSADVNQDGWIDLIVFDFPGTSVVWYENTKNTSGHWKKHLIFEKAGNESPAFADIDGDGKKDLIFSDLDLKQMVWLQAPVNREDLTWKRFNISEENAPGTERFSHGLGVGDINDDGRQDIIITEGWWEGPRDPQLPNWKFNETKVSEKCSQMYVMDVNGDARQDVISASAHLSGVWWQEHQLNTEKEISFEPHVISYAFAESHSLFLADLNNDGHQDIITGKRNLKRNTWRKNPGTDGPPLLYWYEYIPEEPYWKAHQIDNASGSGLNLVAEDMNKDGQIDIIISNFNGVFLFENKMKTE